MANANYTLSNLNGVTDEARSMVLVVGGTNSGIYQVVAPLVTKFYVITNNTSGGYAITIGASSGALITVPNGYTVQVYCDGTNFYSAQTSSAGNFNVNGNFSCTGNVADVGNMTVGGTLGVTGAATFATSPTMPTATTGDNTTKGATTAFVQTAITAAVLSGTIQMWPTASAPSGYLVCDGSAVSRTTYSALFAVVGTTFGSGDGSTTFNVPNYTGRMPYGATIGTTGGSADAIVVSHTHTASSSVSDPGHSHPINVIQGGLGGQDSPLRAQAGSQSTSSATTGITVATSITATGSSGTGANLPPYLGINFIIKT
jgi:microcystin-dependent protein